MFKVGDKIEQVEPWGPGQIGDKFTVYSVERGASVFANLITVEEDPDTRGWFAYRFKLVKAYQPITNTVTDAAPEPGNVAPVKVDPPGLVGAIRVASRGVERPRYETFLPGNTVMTDRGEAVITGVTVNYVLKADMDAFVIGKTKKRPMHYTANVANPKLAMK